MDTFNKEIQKIFSVSELTFSIKKRLESEFAFLCVKGEISNFKAQGSGHLYFTLKDENAQLSVAMFRGDASKLKQLPKNGDKVIVQGEISVYPPRGNYQLIIRKLQFEGVGELLLRFHELKESLEKRGWFSNEHKKPLPPFPKTIGVITSPTGSVIQDIVHVLSRRYSGFHLVLNPVRVQGEGAAAEIAQAIHEMNAYNVADLLIVGRGGGSLEDLWPFNEEMVAEAIFHSKIPVISAVGHETDVTLADYVADVRAPTPSAAAEIALSEKSAHLNHLSVARKRATQFLKGKLDTYRAHLSGISRHPLLASAQTLLAPKTQAIDEVASAIDHHIHSTLQEKKLALLALKRGIHALNPISQVANWKDKIVRIQHQLHHTIRTNLSVRKERLLQLSSHMQGIDPRNLFKKGYCVLFSENRESLILSAKSIKQHDTMLIMMHDGEITATVDEVKT